MDQMEKEFRGIVINDCSSAATTAREALLRFISYGRGSPRRRNIYRISRSTRKISRDIDKCVGLTQVIAKVDSLDAKIQTGEVCYRESDITSYS